jgi:hypothetical protein
MFAFTLLVQKRVSEAQKRVDNARLSDSELVNQLLHFDVFLPTFSRVFKVSIFQLRHSPFFTWFVLRLPRSHRLSSHSRLNAFVIQTKLNSTLKVWRACKTSQ